MNAHNAPGKRKLLSYCTLFLFGSFAITACNNDNDSNNSPASGGEVTDTSSIKLVPSQSSGTLEQYLKGSLKSLEETNDLRISDEESLADGEAGFADAPATENASSSDDFSETNTQVIGVDESDLVKYDGEFLYIASNANDYYWIEDAVDPGFGPDTDEMIPVESDGGIGDGATGDELPKEGEDNSSAASPDDVVILPVDSDGGIGDGATGEELMASDAEILPVEGDGGIGDGATGEELIASDDDFRFAPGYPDYKTSAYIRIMQTQQGDAPSATEANRISLDDSHGYISGMYLYDSSSSDQASSLLAVLSNDHQYYWEDWGRYSAWTESKTYLNLYDVTNPAQYANINTIEIDGSLVDSRRIENTLYLVTRYSPNLPNEIWYAKDDLTTATDDDSVDALTLEELLPKTSNEASGTSGALVDESNCYVPESAVESYYSPALITITAIDLNNPDAMTSVCVAGNNSGIYSSTNALYLFNDQWNEGTIVHKFAFDDAGTVYKGSGTIPGSLGWRAPSFRLHEKDDALIAVSTVFPEVSIGIPTEPVLLEDVLIEPAIAVDAVIDPGAPVHTLTVLKEASDNLLSAVATLPNDTQTTVIGKPNEDIYAVRYIGDRGYIVTYQKTDPLYVVDLSDVDTPAITGELHVEGYSDYLHPIGEDYLVGIGKSAEISNDTAWIQGVQLGLFDVQDLSNPTLISQMEIGNRGTETDVSYNHKAFSFLQLDDNSYRMAFPVNVHDGEQKRPSDWTPWQYNGLHLFNLEIGESASLETAGTIVAAKSDSSNYYGQYVDLQRGVIHGDSIYYVYGDKVLSADWNNPEATTTAAQ